MTVKSATALDTDSIWNDIADAENEIAGNPVYLILNLAKVLAFLKGGLVLSKKEGGEWALGNLPGKYHRLVTDALQAYAGGAGVSCGADPMMDYAVYMTEQIKQRMGK